MSIGQSYQVFNSTSVKVCSDRAEGDRNGRADGKLSAWVPYEPPLDCDHKDLDRRVEDVYWVLVVLRA